MTKQKTPPIVEVEWVDSWSAHGWRNKADHIDHHGAPYNGVMHTIGFLVERNKEWLRTAGSYDGNDTVQWNCLQSIPNSAIRSFRVLRK